MDTLERIVFLRKKCFSSDASFERKLELKPQTINDWKRKKSKSFLKIIPEIAQVLNTTSAYLLCETDDPSPPNQKEATPPIGSEEWLAQGMAARGYNLTKEQISVLSKNLDSISTQFDKELDKGSKK